MSRTVVIRVGAVDQARRELLEDLGVISQGARLPQRREIWFPNLAAAAAALTDRRLVLLRLICDKRPRSMSQLARLAARGKRAVEADVRILARIGLVELVGERAKQRPVARFDRIRLAGDLTLARAAA